MENVPELPESSVISLGSLNQDCLEQIFKLLPLKKLLELRYLSRRLNTAVCQYLRTFHRKLQIFLNVDDQWRNRIEPVFPEIDLERHDGVTYHSDQSHFRLEDFLYLNSFVYSAPNTLDRKVSSLILFLDHVPNLTEFALLIKHESYLWWIPHLLAPLRKLKVLFIDMATRVTSQLHPVAPIAEVVSGMPELECLYYFASGTSHYALFPNFPEFRGNHDNPNHWQVLSSGENFLVTMLRKLRVLHSDGLIYPTGMTFDRVEELKISDNQEDDAKENSFPGVRKLIVNNFQGYLQIAQRFENLTTLKILAELDLSTEIIDKLNQMPNLVELHCRTVYVDRIQNSIERNDTILRLFTTFYNYEGERDVAIEQEWESVTIMQMNGFAADCKRFFRGLQMFTNALPKHVVEYRPAGRRFRLQEN